MRGPKCRMSILRNGNVPCYYFCNIHVDFKISLMLHVEFRNGPCYDIFHMSIGFMSHVDFKEWPCHFVEFKGQGPPLLPSQTSTVGLNTETLHQGDSLLSAWG